MFWGRAALASGLVQCPKRGLGDPWLCPRGSVPAALKGFPRGTEGQALNVRNKRLEEPNLQPALVGSVDILISLDHTKDSLGPFLRDLQTAQTSQLPCCASGCEYPQQIPAPDIPRSLKQTLAHCILIFHTIGGIHLSIHNNPAELWRI